MTKKKCAYNKRSTPCMGGACLKHYICRSCGKYHTRKGQ